MKGNIFAIQHFTVHDGPGIRTTVFLKGCQLHCLWCHNPESIGNREKDLAYLESKCINCGTCAAVCPNNVHTFSLTGKHEVNRELCNYCGKCIKLCPTAALSIAGEKKESLEVIEEVLKDKTYYETSGGGMTISGGEPMSQPDFVKELASLGKKNNLHISMETNGCYSYEKLDGIKENIDLFLVDWKESDSIKHKQLTGIGNKMIYETIRRLHDENFKVLLRCPIIPGINDREEHFRKIVEMTKEMTNLLGAELLPYHRLGISKIKKFGLSQKVNYIEADQPEPKTVNEWVSYCQSLGGNIINEI